MKKILMVGKSTLSQHLKPLCADYEYTEIGRPEFDLTKQKDCDAIVDDYSGDVVVLSQGVFQGDIWQQMTVNTVSLIYLATKFFEKMNSGQIICISSASALWPSWPDIPLQRMIYGISKQAVSNFTQHMQRRNYDGGKPVAVQCYEPCRFPSKVNNWEPGIDISEIVKDVKHLIDNPTVAHIRKINV